MIDVQAHLTKWAESRASFVGSNFVCWNFGFCLFLSDDQAAECQDFRSQVRDFDPLDSASRSRLFFVQCGHANLIESWLERCEVIVGDALTCRRGPGSGPDRQSFAERARRLPLGVEDSAGYVDVCE